MELEILQKADKFLIDLKVRGNLLASQKNSLIKEKQKIETRCSFIVNRLVHLHLAKKVVQEIIEVVGKENLIKIEMFMDRALNSIFPDLNLHFKIEQQVKRGNNVYSFILYQNGVEGNVNSFGGGVIAVVSVVLKVLFNIITKRFPLLCLDETLSFLAVNYIPAMSDFLKTLAKEFNIPILLVTHQPQFATSADICYEIDLDKQGAKLTKLT